MLIDLSPDANRGIFTVTSRQLIGRAKPTRFAGMLHPLDAHLTTMLFPEVTFITNGFSVDCRAWHVSPLARLLSLVVCVRRDCVRNLRTDTYASFCEGESIKMSRCYEEAKVVHINWHSMHVDGQNAL